MEQYQDLQKEIKKLQQNLSETNKALAETQTMIRDYNGLREKVEWSVNEIYKMQGDKTGSDNTTMSAREWMFLAIAVASLLIAVYEGGV